MEPEALLIHADFVRSLARWLVQDENLAEELVQQTLVAAMQASPSEDKPIRAWLAKVLRNFARAERRSRAIQSRHQKAAATTHYARSTDQVVELEEKRRAVIDAVLSLREPYRTVVLLRFYDELPPRKIAARTGVPVDTVSSQLQRGKEQLKQCLNARYGGDGTKWLLSILPLASLGLIAGPARATLNAGLAAALVAGLALIAWQVWPGGPGAPQPPDLGGPAAAVGGTSRAQAQPLKPPVETGAGGGEIETVPATGQIIAGSVRDIESGEAVREYLATLEAYGDCGWSRDQQDAEIVRDALGRFGFPVEAGRYALRIESPRHKPFALFNIVVEPGHSLAGLEVALDPGSEIRGVVVDASTGMPAAGALVAPCSAGDILLDRMKTGSMFRPHAMADSQGRFVLRGIESHGAALRIAAVHEDYAEAVVQVIPRDGSGPWSGSDTGVVIALEQGGRITGRAVGDGGAPACGVVITTYGEGQCIRRPVLTDQDGAYRTLPVPPGWSWVAASPFGREDGGGSGGEFTREVKRIWVDAGGATVDFGPEKNQAAWTGVARDRKGKPVAGARVELFAEDEAGRSRAAARSDCDAAGRFAFRKLAPGRYGVKLHDPLRRTGACAQTVLLRAGPIEQDLQVTGAGIAGRIMDGGTGQPVRHGRVCAWPEEPPENLPVEFTAEPGPTGAFQMDGLPPGHYVLEWLGGIPVAGLLPDDGAWAVAQELAVAIDSFDEIACVEIVVPPTGVLVVEGSGLDPSDWASLHVSVRKKDSPSPSLPTAVAPAVDVRSDGSWISCSGLETGAWTLVVGVDRVGRLETEIIVRLHDVTELCVDVGDLVPCEGLVAATGVLRRADGVPLAGRRLLFVPAGEGAATSDRIRSRAITAADGSFRADGLAAGPWQVWLDRSGDRAFAGEWKQLHLANVDIPAGAAGPIWVDAVEPAGSIRAELFDGITGAALSAEASWSAYVCDAAGEAPVCIHVNGGGPGCAMEGILEGDHRFVLKADGYATYESEVFFLRRGQPLSLGRVMLERAGAVVVELCDPRGQRITAAFSVRDAGTKRRFSGAEQWGGWFRVDLPARPYQLLVEATGYAKQVIAVTPIAGETEKVRVLLSPE